MLQILCSSVRVNKSQPHSGFTPNYGLKSGGHMQTIGRTGIYIKDPHSSGALYR